MSPLSNSYRSVAELNRTQKFHPLHALVCSKCFLVQLEAFESPDAIFSDYAYFSSYSDSWLNHMQTYVASVTQRFALKADKNVVEIASNDGYLLQYFVKQGIPVLGIEPAANVAKVALEKGIPTIVKFFGIQAARELADQGRQADLLIGNNVLAHVPDINDFVQGMKILLKPDGVITMEFPHFLRLFENCLFDTIYHEHFSYLSLITVDKIFSTFGLTLFDVEEIPTHGGSLRIYAGHANSAQNKVSENVTRVKSLEHAAKLDEISTYTSFGSRVEKIKLDLLTFLIGAKNSGKIVAAYGAPAKGNTLLNYCGIRTDLLDFTVDRSPHKQNMFLPGSHIPIYAPEYIRQVKPDFLLILPWNIKEEIIGQMSYILEWGGKFVTALPHLKIIG
jgi:2-polyprenyl-3-methyl-5-hydroxy-6-metoxy-1,4-benzoquinol methylase